MQLGTVIGSATSTVKHSSLQGWKLLVVQLTGVDGQPDGEPVLAIDHLGAGQGSQVMLTTDAVLIRELVKAKNSPIRFAVMGLTDDA